MIIFRVKIRSLMLLVLLAGLLLGHWSLHKQRQPPWLQMRLLRNGELIDRSMALGRLEEMGHDGLPALSEVLSVIRDDPHVEMRRRAARTAALIVTDCRGRNRDAELDQLLSTARKQLPNWKAFPMPWRIGDQADRVAEALLAAARNDEDIHVRQQAIESLLLVLSMVERDRRTHRDWIQMIREQVDGNPETVWPRPAANPVDGDWVHRTALGLFDFTIDPDVDHAIRCRIVHWLLQRIGSGSDLVIDQTFHADVLERMARGFDDDSILDPLTRRWMIRYSALLGDQPTLRDLIMTWCETHSTNPFLGKSPRPHGTARIARAILRRLRVSSWRSSTSPWRSKELLIE